MNTLNPTASESFADRSRQKCCSSCGVRFGCGPASGAQGCWCEALPHVGLVAAADQDCLCPDCLSRTIAKLPGITATTRQQNDALPKPLVEGEDYYCEGAAIVFTAAYHLHRGYCCDSGCRHCPYETRHDTEASLGA